MLSISTTRARCATLSLLLCCFGVSLLAQNPDVTSQPSSETDPARVRQTSVGFGAALGIGGGSVGAGGGLNFVHRFNQGFSLGASWGRAVSGGSPAVRATGVGVFGRFHTDTDLGGRGFGVFFEAGPSMVTLATRQSRRGKFTPVSGEKKAYDAFALGLAPAVSYTGDKVRVVGYLVSVNVYSARKRYFGTFDNRRRSTLNAGFTPGINLEFYW